MSLIRYLLLVIVVVAGLSGCSAVKLSLKNTPTLANAMGVAEITERDLRREYVNRDSRFVEVNGFNIHYRDEGNPDGPVIVLLHGIMSSLHTWDDWTAGLRKDYRVIRLDVPGYGLTGIPDDFDVDQMDDALLISTFERFIDELELKRFSLAGNSLGGYISAMYAARHPEKVEKLILLDPVAYPQELPWLFHLATGLRRPEAAEKRACKALHLHVSAPPGQGSLRSHAANAEGGFRQGTPPALWQYQGTDTDHVGQTGSLGSRQAGRTLEAGYSECRSPYL